MRVLEEGRVYAVRNFDSDGYQEIKFTRRRHDGNFSEGTTVEELIRVLRDKFYHFNSIAPSLNNTACIDMCDEMLRECLNRLNKKKEDVSRLKSDK
jgi:hypothetical protein